MAQRVVIGLLATLAFLAVTGGARAQTHNPSETPRAGSCARLELTMKLAGEIKVKQDDKEKTLKETAAAQHDFFERVLDVGTGGLVDRAARYYHKAETTIAVGDAKVQEESQRKLRTERALLV